jgi:hypothetical protein
MLSANDFPHFVSEQANQRLWAMRKVLVNVPLKFAFDFSAEVFSNELTVILAVLWSNDACTKLALSNTTPRVEQGTFVELGRDSDLGFSLFDTASFHLEEVLHQCLV